MRRLFPRRDEFDLTDGDIGRPLLYLSLPLVVSNLLQTAYNLADTFWLGQYGTEELAAITFAFPLVWLFISLGLGLSVAGAILVAQHTGADDPEAASFAAGQTLTATFLVSAMLGVATYFLVDPVLALLGASDAVRPLATGYMRLIGLAMPLLFGFSVFVSLMRGYGDTVTPMVVMFGTVVLNMALDPVFIFGWGPVPELGIVGAAYATVGARALAMAVGLWILFRGAQGPQLKGWQLRPHLPTFGRLARLGLPASFDGMGSAISVNLMLAVVSLFATPVVAGYGIAVRIFSLVFLPAIAVEQGVETMTGQNIGAGKPDRAARTAAVAARTMGVALSALGVVVWVAAQPIASVFSGDPEVVAVAVEFLRVVAVSFGGIGIARAYTGAFRGAGKTLNAAVVSIVVLGVLRLPIAVAGAFAIGRVGIWVGFAVSNLLGALLAYGWYRRGTWRGGTVTGDRAAVDTLAED
ncbi:MATE family efflux transporter [Halomarina ordinaria]|uniref:MATE family efflux transporter n=1 Tax=Halomarina ordinaria TaxID=3033939 RepID=A0ABD5UIG1_9EURY|nr:MATE family efflux transporter [Halomarina sp. PSRA2]